MYTYFTYGLSINSVIPLPELLTSEETESDVIIKTGNIEWSPSGKICHGGYCCIDANEACFFWEKVGVFLVRGGREIIVEPFPGADERLIRQPLLGVVLAALLHQRGHLVLHASAVAINTNVVAFLGEKGIGKSTLSAVLYTQGHRILVDDILAINFNGAEGAIVHPGFPQIRLWPDAVASLGEDPETWERLHPGVEKRVRQVASGILQTAFQLKHIYVIVEGPELKIEPVTAQEAFIELIRHSFPTRLYQPGGETHFCYCAAIARNIPVYRIRRPSSLSLLPDIAKVVEKHLCFNTQLLRVCP